MYQQLPENKMAAEITISRHLYMWWPCLLTDRDEMSNLHRGHSIDASYQVLVVAMFANRSGLYIFIEDIP